MKAKYKEKFDRYILSIGMIVKNEEKNLRDCLESLIPLREAVPSELIIVDTGSEDGTVDIAKEYTENVFSFQWNNDFSAARNYGLDRATGKWFMFIDADERLNRPNELADFLNSPEAEKNYATAEIIISSVLDEEESLSSDFTASRLFRMNTGNRFHGTIHEVPYRMEPVKTLQESYLKHYGYLYKTEEDRQRKFKRNNNLLEGELQKNPEDIRLICLYAASCPDEERQELLERGRELVKTQLEHYYFAEVYWRLSREYLRQNKYEEVIEVGMEYKELVSSDHVGEVELSYNMGIAYGQLNQYQESLDAFNRYIDLYQRYKDGSLIAEDKFSNVCERAGVSTYNTIFPRMATSLDKLGHYEEAFHTVTRADLRELPKNIDASIIVFVSSLACKAERLDWLIEAEKWVKDLQLPAEREKPFITNFVNVYLQKESEMPDGVGITEKIDSTFGKLVYLGNSDESETWDALLLQMTTSENQAEGEQYGVIALYYALRNGKNLLPLVQNTKVETLQKWNIRLAKQAEKLGDILVNYHLEQAATSNMPIRFWLADLETRLLGSCSEEYKLPMAHRVSEDISWYVNHLYNDKILNPGGIQVLPSAQRFAYWCGKALEAKEQGNTSGYVKLLGEASRSCPEMAEVAKLLIQEVRDNDETLKAQREQQELAGKIKGIIEGMILAGNQADAQSILAQYELIAPGDPDIPALKAAILQQPSLTEI